KSSTPNDLVKFYKDNVAGIKYSKIQVDQEIKDGTAWILSPPDTQKFACQKFRPTLEVHIFRLRWWQLNLIQLDEYHTTKCCGEVVHSTRYYAKASAL
ncbi:hypothetical protein Trydic_g14332, partial [Trypoxylus dichotomus]